MTPRQCSASRVALRDAGLMRALAGERPMRPYAVYAFEQSDYAGGHFSLFTVHGGPLDKSTVAAETLQRLGIAVPVREGGR